MKQIGTIRSLCAGVCFWLFLKLIGQTNEEYWEEIYQQEKQYKQNL